MPDDDELLNALRRWTTDARSQSARDERASGYWQQQLAREEMRFSGLLLDLLERGSTLTLTTTTGRTHSGRLTAVGQDFATVSGNSRATVAIAAAGIASVRVDGSPRSFGVASSRHVDAGETRLAGLLASLSADRSRVRFVLTGTPTVQTGELFSVGEDVVTIGLEQPVTQTLFVEVARFNEVSISN